LPKLQARKLIVSRARDLEYSKKQLLLIVGTSILTWLRQSLSDWSRPILTYFRLTPSETVTERWWRAKGFCC